MRLWLLRPVPHEAGGWDTVQGFVIAAPDEATARHLAQECGADEVGYSAKRAYWTEPEIVTCIELRSEDYQEAEVVLTDFNAG